MGAARGQVDPLVPHERRSRIPRAVAAGGPCVLVYVESSADFQTFVVSGVPELPDNPTGPEDVVRLGEICADALLEKLQFVIDAVAARVETLGARWDSSAAVHLYAAHDLAFPLVREVLSATGIVPVHGIAWHDAAPPIELLELEVDVRRYAQEVTIG